VKMDSSYDFSSATVDYGPGAGPAERGQAESKASGGGVAEAKVTPPPGGDAKGDSK
jgi:hypothetical protein